MTGVILSKFSPEVFDSRSLSHAEVAEAFQVDAHGGRLATVARSSPRTPESMIYSARFFTGGRFASQRPLRKDDQKSQHERQAQVVLVGRGVRGVRRRVPDD